MENLNHYFNKVHTNMKLMYKNLNQELWDSKNKEIDFNDLSLILENQQF